MVHKDRKKHNTLYWIKNKDELNKRRREKYHIDAEYRFKLLQRQKIRQPNKQHRHEYYLKNKEKIKKRNTVYQQNNSEKTRIRHKRWRDNMTEEQKNKIKKYKLINQLHFNAVKVEKWNSLNCDEQREKREYRRRVKLAFYHKNKERIDSQRRKIRKANQEYYNYLSRKNNLKIKTRVLIVYSNNKIPECVCCGEKTIEFLTIDHINGRDKTIHPAHFGGISLYKYLIKNAYPTGYQTMCFNCNFAKGHFSICPHQNKK